MPLPKQRILIVEDDMGLAGLMQGMLEMEGFATEHAKSTRSALDLLEFQDPYDLVIMDLDLPDYDGIVACQMVRTLENPIKAATPVIICTGCDTLEHRRKGFLVGAVDFITKGDFLDELLLTVRRVLHADDHSPIALRALIVEPDRWIRHIIQQALKEISISSLETTDGQNGIDLWRTFRHSIMLTVIGGHFAEPNEMQLLRAIREEADNQIPVIAICERDGAPLIADFLRCGGTDYITKPFHKEDFAFKLSVHLELRKKQLEKVG